MWRLALLAGDSAGMEPFPRPRWFGSGTLGQNVPSRAFGSGKSLCDPIHAIQ